jgi:hypothetical protein
MHLITRHTSDLPSSLQRHACSGVTLKLDIFDN